MEDAVLNEQSQQLLTFERRERAENMGNHCHPDVNSRVWQFGHFIRSDILAHFIEHNLMLQEKFADLRECNME